MNTVPAKSPSAPIRIQAPAGKGPAAPKNRPPAVPRAASRALALLVLLAMTLVAGCFDYELELVLKENGSGTLSAILVTPDTAGPPPAKLMEMLLPNPVRSTKKVGKRLVTKDTGIFDFLDAVALHGFAVNVDEVSFGVLGMTDHTYRISLSLYPVEGDRPDRKALPGTEREVRPPDPEPADPALRRARRMVGSGIKGNHLIVTYRLPGEVRNALPPDPGLQPDKAGDIRGKNPGFLADTLVGADK